MEMTGARLDGTNNPIAIAPNNPKGEAAIQTTTIKTLLESFKTNNSLSNAKIDNITLTSKNHDNAYVSQVAKLISASLKIKVVVKIDEAVKNSSSNAHPLNLEFNLSGVKK